MEAFAAEVAQHTYRRLSRSVNEAIHRERIAVGKYGEVAFSRFLEKNGREPLGAEDMFTVWEGTENVDALDFKTVDGKTVDVKTAYKSYQRLILVPEDQFQSQRKDYYVGVRLDLSGPWADIKGYATPADMMLLGVQDKGEGPCYIRALRDLRPIAELLAKFPPASGR